MKKLLIIILILVRSFLYGQVGAGMAKVDSLEYDAAFSLARIGLGQVKESTYWVVAWSDAQADGWLGSFTCSDAGVLGDAMTDTWEFGDGETHGVMELYGIPNADYIIFTEGDDGNPAYMRSVVVSSSNGSITNSFAGSMWLSADDYVEGRIRRLNETDNYVYAFRDDGNSDYGKVITFSFNTSTGAMTKLDSLIFVHDTAMWDQDIVQHGSSSTWLVGTEKGGTESTVRSLDINPTTGAISDALIDSLELSLDASNVSILQLGSSDYFASIGGHTTNNDLQVYTYTCNSSGVISTEIEAWNSNEGFFPFPAFYLGPNKVFLWGGGSNAQVFTINIADGDITTSLDYDVGINPNMINNKTMKIASSDSNYYYINAGRYWDDNDGWIRTMTVKGAPDGGWSHDISGINTPASVNGLTDFTSINGVQ